MGRELEFHNGRPVPADQDGADANESEETDTGEA